MGLCCGSVCFFFGWKRDTSYSQCPSSRRKSQNINSVRIPRNCEAKLTSIMQFIFSLCISIMHHMFFFPSFSADIMFAFAVYHVHHVFIFKALQRMTLDRDVNCHSNIPKPSAPVRDNEQPGLESDKSGGKPPLQSSPPYQKMF